MPFWRTYYHFVWATKSRAPSIQPDFEWKLFQYFISKAEELDIQVYAVNGWHDHVHLVASVPPKHAIAEVVRQLKGGSAHYLNHVVNVPFQFAWQRGYGVFTLGEQQSAKAIAYVQQQKEHHTQQTTNAWLERTDEADEGPPLAGLRPEDVQRGVWQLREAGAVYALLGDGVPF